MYATEMEVNLVTISKGSVESESPLMEDAWGITEMTSDPATVINLLANILFLESPAGVGFSYSNTTSDYKTTGDKITAKDSYTFLINWLERFPEYKTRDFYLTGESYSGHYIPQLAEFIIKSNKNANRTVINLKGIVIGNSYMDDETQQTGTHDFFWSRSITSDEIHKGIVTNCDFSWNATLSKVCKNYINQEYDLVGNIYPYDIYAPLCLNRTSSEKSEFDPCSLEYIESYLNLPEVQKSLHANLTGLPGRWQDCNDELFDNWKDQPFTVLPTIRRLMASGIRVWLYSGDTDSSVPVTTTMYAIKKLNTTVKTPWHPWYLKGEVGGYVVEYENLTFVTVRGAGHFVPSYQPARAIALFSSFLHGKFPGSNTTDKAVAGYRLQLRQHLHFSIRHRTFKPSVHHPFHLGRKTRDSQTNNDDSFEEEDVENDSDFAFGHLERHSISAADELFDGGKIKPLKPPPRLHFSNDSHSPRSPKSPKLRFKEALSPRSKKKDFDPFSEALKQTSGEQTNPEENPPERGREQTTKSTRRKASRSLSPFRVSDVLNNQKNSTTGQSSPTGLTWYNKWNLKNLLLFRSASEGSVSTRKDPLKKYTMLKKSDRDVKTTFSFRSTDSGGSMNVSADDTAADQEEIGRKTTLPYKSGLMGCLRFHQNAGSVHEISRGIDSLMKQ
ncbi:unnamed protein product [Lactuca virosa]|uniref:Carboxypeptidase n=1 Tax=Lactuca virosa TaxID=75947 RepID=A0AAU9MH00_9ASTR|nr:unnamed protein product [Lactuca virosa]